MEEEKCVMKLLSVRCAGPLAYSLHEYSQLYYDHKTLHGNEKKKKKQEEENLEDN